MQLKESGEMYLETIYLLSKKHSYVRSVDVGEEMGYSKPSVSRAMGLLKEGGYVVVGRYGDLHLTKLGKEVAERTYERHAVLAQLFEALGVDPEIAANDACRMEHIISDQTFDAIKKHMREMNIEPIKLSDIPDTRPEYEL